MDNRNPHEFLVYTQGLSARADTTQQNGFGTFVPFAVTVLVAYATGDAEQSTINLLTVLFIALRLIFIYCYLADKSTM